MKTKAAAPMKSTLSGRAMLRSFLRSSMVNADYNPHGMQSLGFVWSLMPGLRCLYPDGKDFARSCQRYSQRHNCHPFWGPFLTGAFLNIEAQIAAGRFTPDQFTAIRETSLNTLSAIGDSLFSGSMSVSMFFLAVCFAAEDSYSVAIALMLGWLLFSFLAKAILFAVGLGRGIGALLWLRRINLINLGDYLKVFNAVLLALFLILATGVHGLSGFNESEQTKSVMTVLRQWFIPVGIILLLGYLVSKLHFTRSALVVLAILLTSFFLNSAA